MTGVLIFISPSSATQAAMACIFAFGSLLGFELLRPHLDPTDSWLYRLVSCDNVIARIRLKPRPREVLHMFYHSQSNPQRSWIVQVLCKRFRVLRLLSCDNLAVAELACWFVNARNKRIPTTMRWHFHPGNISALYLCPCCATTVTIFGTTHPQGCVIIFLSNFLALLIKVDAGEEENREIFGALLIAVNVLLVLAVLVTSWFATQQSVDDHREGENSFTVAKTILTAEQFAANNARFQRSGRAPMSSASSAVRPGFPPSDRHLVWRGTAGTLRRHGTGVTEAPRIEKAMPSLARDYGSGSDAEGGWSQKSEGGSSWDR